MEQVQNPIKMLVMEFILLNVKMFHIEKMFVKVKK